VKQRDDADTCKCRGEPKANNHQPSERDVSPGGDQHPLMPSLLTFEAKGKKLLIDDWSNDLEKSKDKV
jgi:hypothetical protein